MFCFIKVIRMQRSQHEGVQSARLHNNRHLTSKIKISFKIVLTLKDKLQNFQMSKHKQFY